MYDVGMTTVSSVILILKTLGYVTGAQGRGVYVNDKKYWPRQS